MEIPADKYKSDENRPGPLPTVMQIVRKFSRWLAGLVILTEEDRIKAGIALGGEGRDG